MLHTPASTDHLELIFCASTLTPAWGTGWCITATPALVKPAKGPVVMAVPLRLLLASA